MKERKGLRAESLSLYFILGTLLLFSATKVLAQTRIMPIGNSITWGKVSNQPPPPGTSGYRKPLHDKLTADVNTIGNVIFVGGYTSYAGDQSPGYFSDNAQIGWFLSADSAMGNIADTLALYQPDIVLLHIGTNDIGQGNPLGDYATPGSIINHLYTMVTRITDSPFVDDLLLCRIIPRLLTPGDEIETVDYNNAIELMLSDLDGAQRAKVTLIDMWTPFYANQSAYYDLAVDKVHPNVTGYNALSNIFYHYISNLLVPSFTDEFARGAGGLHDTNGWVALEGINVVDMGENGGGAIQFRPLGLPDDDQWDNLCVWGTSRNLTTVSVRIHSNSSGGETSAFGLAVGLDTVKTTASGYLLWIYNGAIRIRTIVTGNASIGTDVASWPMNPLLPGDVLKVGYRQATDANYFTFSVNGSDPLTLRDLNKLAGNAADLYSGVLFRGPDGMQPRNILIDNFSVESQLPDVIPPGRIFDFDYFTAANTSVTLTWTAPGNDEYTGAASSYDIRFSLNPMGTEEDFANANIFGNVPKPNEAGTIEIFTASGLLPGTRYYFRIRAVDDWGNKGDLSDEATVRTLSAGQVVEDFDRETEPDGSIGDDWIIDPNEYEIEWNPGTGEGEFSNFQTDGAWGRVAVYRGRTNPSMVKMVWGRNATPDGIAQGGLALMLTKPDLTANGYIVWVRIPLQRILLYRIENGAVVGDGKVDEVSYILRDEFGDLDFPTGGDTMSVVMDWNNDSGHRFDVFINGIPAADRALFDPLRRYNSTTKYSGLLLGRNNRQNNVTAFITLSEYTGASSIQAVAGTDQTGIVGTVLGDSLKVEVRDANSTPLPGVPVKFTVVDPNDASVSAPSAAGDDIHIEAEWGVLSGTYNVKNDDPSASGDKYIVAPTGGPNAGTAVYQFTVEKDTTYYFWGRVIAPNVFVSAISIQIDNNPPFTWNSLWDRWSNDWTWDWLNDNGDRIFHRLSPNAVHTITVTKLHDNVKMDKFFITPSSAYVPTNKEYVEQLVTDNNGMAGTKLTLGTKAGINRVMARPFGTIESVQFLATALPDLPRTMTKTNDLQSGVARDTLDRAFIVTLYDQFGNRTPNIPVAFTILSGGGELTVEVDTTDTNGQASTFLMLGSGDPTNTVQATFTGYAGGPVIFTATATSGLVTSIRRLEGIGFGQRHYVNQVLPNFVRVEVLDDQDQPMNAVPVIFEVIGGDGSLGVQPKWTGANGVAQDTLRLGPTSSVVSVSARIGAIVDTAAVDSAFYRGARVQFYSGSNQSAPVLDTLEYRLRVRVIDPINRPVEGHPVAFASQGQGFLFPDGSDSVIVTTNWSGLAETNVLMAPLHGVYPNIIHAWSSDGFNPIPESPVKFTLYAKSQATRLKRVEGDSLEWIVRERLPQPLRVQMVDALDVGVPNQPVEFRLIQGGGLFEGTLLPLTTVITDGNGYAQISYTLGAQAGFFNNVVEARATNGVDPLFGSPVRFHISATSSSADSLRAFTSTTITGVVGRRLPQPVQVQITDRLGNPVSREWVTFSIISPGGGTLDTLNAVNGSADTTKRVYVNNAGGIASILWTLGDTAGTINNVLDARSDNGLITLRGSPIRFYASGIPDVVSASRSIVEATGPVQASGLDTSFVTIILTDAYGNAIANKRVSLEVIGGDLNFVQQPILPTDDQGRTLGHLQSLSAGEKQIRATDIDDNLPIDNEASVIFLANDAAKLLSHFGNNQTGNTGTVLKDSLAVKITDDINNPVAYGPVTFTIRSGGGRIIEPQPVVSDSNGLAWVHLVLGPMPGENLVEVSSAGLLGSPTFFTAFGEEGTPVSMFRISGNAQIGDAGQVLPQPFVVGVNDLDGDPVAGVDIRFEVEAGGGSFVTPQPVKTNEWGLAYSYFRTDVVSGSNSYIQAYNLGLSGSPVIFTASSLAGPARRIEYISGSGQSGYVDEKVPYPLVVKVTDQHGNAVIGVTVQFTVVGGDATLNDSQGLVNTTTNTLGLASTTVKLGSTTGPVSVEATSSFLEGSPVVFTLYIQTLQASSILKHSGDNQKGAVDRLFVDPLRVRVVDIYGNAVPGIRVFFNKQSGEGSIVEVQPVVSDDNGIASVRFMAGSVPGISVVTALWYDKVVTFTLETVYNTNFPILDKAIISSTYEVYEGDELLIPLVATDGDGDQLIFRIANPFPPAGATLEATSLNTAFFRWIPSYGQEGTYEIILQVIDGRGGSDQIVVTIQVLGVNQAPEILSTSPTQDTTVAAGQTVQFYVSARDPDGDILHYSWKVDGIPRGTDSPIFEYFINKYFIGNMTVDVYVYDAVTPVSYRWVLNVTTAVEMAEFMAWFNEGKRSVVVQWSTSHERDNIGFDVYRSRSENGEYEKITDTFIPSQESGEYSFMDKSVRVGQVYYYKLQNIDARGVEREFGPVMIKVPAPQKFMLTQNYPNPFNPVTSIRYTLPSREMVTLTIYNMMGQHVVTLVDTEQESGYYVAEWDGKDRSGQNVSTGIYIYQLRTSREKVTKRMIKMQ